MNIENKIRTCLNLRESKDISIYKDISKRKYYANEIIKIVNDNVPKIQNICNNKILNEINKNGYSIVDNFLTNEEVNLLKDHVKDLKGYNFHIPGRALNCVPQIYSKELNWNICSYKTNHLLSNHFILKLITRPDIVSLAQEYLGCLPIISSVNMWWSKYNGEKFHTQQLHRDYDDFKFLTFFIYLSDVDEKNGPHVYYEGTHNGSEPLGEKITITGKAGTAIFADTYALHYGKPLEQGERLMFWSRYCLYKNNNFYRDNAKEYKLEKNMFFDIIEDNPINRHLLSAYVK